MMSQLLMTFFEGWQVLTEDYQTLEISGETNFNSDFWQKPAIMVYQGVNHMIVDCDCVPKERQHKSDWCPSFGIGWGKSVSLLSGCWDRWSSQKPKYQYRDHLVG